MDHWTENYDQVYSSTLVSPRSMKHETHLATARVFYLTKRLKPVHQQEELVGAMLLRSSRRNGSS